MRTPSTIRAATIAVLAALLTGCSASSQATHTVASIPPLQLVFPGANNWASVNVAGSTATNPPHVDRFMATLATQANVTSWYRSQLFGTGWHRTTMSTGPLASETFVKGDQMFTFRFQVSGLPVSAFDGKQPPSDITDAVKAGATMYATTYFPTSPHRTVK